MNALRPPAPREERDANRLVGWLAHYRAFWPGRIKRLRAVLDEMSE